MEIFLLRHGIAEDPAPGTHDGDRALTPKGERKLKDVLERAREAGARPSVILSSPLLRARQTARLAADALGDGTPILESKDLLPGSSPKAVWEEIRSHRDEAAVLLAGHEPLFSALYAYLLAAPGVVVAVKKGSLGRIDVESFGPNPRGVLRWLITPATS